MNGLKAAHKGYQYQDLLTAYVLAETLARRYDSITIDKKLVNDDRFDDLEIIWKERRVRRQIKSSFDLNRQLSTSDIKTEQVNLRIDKLVLSFIQTCKNESDEFRLCATWQTPSETELLELLEPVPIPKTLGVFPSECYRLRSDVFWPNQQTPIWECIRKNADITREDFLRFCDRFIIELGLPSASLSILNPGPLEEILLDTLASVGIGRYPNHNRQLNDVAALIIRLAASARSDQLTLKPHDIELHLQIRTDYGRVSQAFPFNEKIFQDQKAFREKISNESLSGKHQIITGPPGAGKSWLLTSLTNDLRDSGALIARHYCFLEPGDENVELRITVDVLFANLIAELVDVVPSLRDKSKSRYSAGPYELEEILVEAASIGNPIILVIDGVDHIARVRSEAKHITDIETDIVEQLAALDIPDGVSLLIGSQPGVHLDVLHQNCPNRFIEHQIPSWSSDAIVSLSKKLGVIKPFIKAGILDPTPILQLLAERSEGNPLYGTYLACGLRDGLEDGSITSAEDWLNDVPIISGNIAKYYSYLYQQASNETKALGDILGVIDFGVSEDDLQEIVPSVLSDWIPQALNVLRPILANVTYQGGLRIFHESFRRFMLEELKRSGRTPAHALEPVIKWLENQGFYQSAKSYRFLFPALRRAHRFNDLHAHVGVNFVSESVKHGHPIEAVQRNLSLALDAAARTLNWPILVRCVELHRSAYTCYEDRMLEPINYWESYLDLFGAKALVERLVFDGRPIQHREIGLVLCSLVDDAGVTPPWKEYISLPRDEPSSSYEPTDQQTNELPWINRVSLSELHGRLRVHGDLLVAPNIIKFLREKGEEKSRSFIRAIARRFARIAGIQATQELINKIDRCQTVAPHILAAFRLGFVDELARQGKDDQVTGEVGRVLLDLDSPLLAVDCLALGAPVHQAAQLLAVNPADLSLGMGQYSPEPNSIRNWIISIRLLAGVNDSVLQAELERVEGEGWYRCWLRFLISLARAEAARRSALCSPTVIDAFKELSKDIRPFTGSPRPCDLYKIREVIADSLSWGFSLLQTEDEWGEALKAFRDMLDGTSVMLERSPGGPVTPETAIKLLLPYATRTDVGVMIRSFAEKEVREGEEIGSYFENHAQRAMTLARISVAVGDIEEAQSEWKRASVFLGAYGWRKDVTIFDLIESAPTLVQYSEEEALKALVALQPLSQALLRHTDGRETKHSSNAWFRSLLEVSSPIALEVLARSIFVRAAITGWPIARAIGDATSHLIKVADPALVATLQGTLPFEADHEKSAEEYADERLASIGEILKQDSLFGTQKIQQLIGKISGDSRRHREAAIDRVTSFSEANNIELPSVALEKEEEPTHPSGNYSRHQEFKHRLSHLSPKLNFEKDSKIVDLINGIRSIARQEARGIEQDWPGYVNAIGYRLVTIATRQSEDEAIRLVQFIAHTVNIINSANHPLLSIGEGLERFGFIRAATVAYALAYTYTRGGGGWLAMGDKSQANIFDKAITLGRQEAQETLSSEIAYSLRSFSYFVGLTRHIIERVADWGEPAIAKLCWWEAYKVISFRLPISSGQVGWFENLCPAEAPSWTMNEGIAAVLLATLNDPRQKRKIEALTGLKYAIERLSDIVISPLQWFLTRDAGLTSTILILHLLLKIEQSPYPISRSISNLIKDYSNAQSWGLRLLARLLLERISIAYEIRPLNLIQSSGESLTAETVQTILTANKGNRLRKLERIWPGVSELVANRMDEIFEGAEIHKSRCRNRYRLAFGEDQKEYYPGTPLLMWETELLETALHEILNGLTDFLWKNGLWNSNIEAEVLEIVLPETLMHLCLHASRTVRPLYASPVEFSAGRVDVPEIKNQDPRFQNWRRIGYVEQQWVRDPNHRYDPPKKRVAVFAGVIVEPFGHNLGEDISPFRSGSASDWLITENSQHHQFPIGAITSLDRIRDWLGDFFVLIPPNELFNYYSLFPSSYAEPLAWKDSSGENAIFLRTWWVRNSGSLLTESPEYVGTDLLIRPDLFDKVATECGGILREFSIVRETELPH